MTQHEKILNHMKSDPTRWWLPQDFMKNELGDLFVGYEASARLSELAKLYPNMIESKRQGKYMARRLITQTSFNKIDEKVEMPEHEKLIDIPVKRRNYL